MPRTSKIVERTLRISYKIPCTPLLKKILQKHLTTTPYKLSVGNLSGKIMLGLMALKQTSKSTMHFGPEMFEIEIPTYYWQNYPLKGIRDDHAAILLNYHYETFTQNLFSFIDSRLILRAEGDTRNRLSIQKSIFEFCKAYGITDEDIQLDTLLKDYYRTRQCDKSLGTSYIRKKSIKVSDSKIA